MRKTVHKFDLGLDTATSVTIKLPRAAKFLFVGYQGNEDHIFVWAEVDPTAPEVKRVIYLVRTGETIPPGSMYIGTVHDGNGYIVHVFDDGREVLA